MKVLEEEGRQQKEELQEVHGRLSEEEQKKEEARHKAFTLKQRVVECEAAWEAALQEVRLWGGALGVPTGVCSSVNQGGVCVLWVSVCTTVC